MFTRPFIPTFLPSLQQKAKPCLLRWQLATLFLLFAASGTAQHKIFTGELHYVIRHLKNTSPEQEPYTTIYCAGDRFYRIDQPTHRGSEGGFTHHLFLMRNSDSLDYYLINPTLAVALRQKFSLPLCTPYKTVADSGGQMTVVMETNTSTNPAFNARYTAVHIVDKEVAITQEQFATLCYTYIGAVFGRMVIQTSTKWVQDDRVITSVITLHKKVAKQVPEEMFRVPAYYSIEHYTDRRFSELVLEYRNRRK